MRREPPIQPSGEVMASLYAEHDAEWARRRAEYLAEKEARQGRPRVPEAKRKALMAEVWQHRHERGYALTVAAREGLCSKTLKYLLKKAGMKTDGLFCKPAAVRAEADHEPAAASDAPEDEGDAKLWKRCGFTHRHCPLAIDCEWGEPSIREVSGEFVSRIEVCVHAIQGEFNDCRTCPHMRRCGKAWRCFKLERLAADGWRAPDLRSKAGVVSGAGKTTPKACGAICNGDATSFRGGCDEGAERSER